MWGNKIDLNFTGYTFIVSILLIKINERHIRHISVLCKLFIVPCLFEILYIDNIQS